MQRFLYIIFLLSVLAAEENSPLLNLEEQAQDIVLETKRIIIPGYPEAFNPSIIRWRGSLLMSFRIIFDPKLSFNSDLGIVHLDENFNPVGEPQLINLRDEHFDVPCRAEDARLIANGDQLFMIYSDNTDAIITRGGFRVYISELHYDGEYFAADNIECLTEFEGESKMLREKNWIPFIHAERLLLAYSLDPHRIFRPIGAGVCETICTTAVPIQWPWGQLRGGTPALKNDDGEYLGFFHSSKMMESVHSEGKNVLHYFFGAYTFSSDFPFEFTQISQEPIVACGFYNGPIYKPYWHPVRVVFPGGYISDHDYIWLTYGRQNHEVWVAKIDKKKLMQSLAPVRN